MRAQSAKTERRILLNASALSVAEGLGQLANFVFVISFARTFGATQMAYYSVAMASGAIAALFMTLGTQGLLVREFSRDRTRVAEWLGVLFPVQGLLALGSWLVATAITVLLVGDSRAISVALAICGYQVLLRLAGVLNTPLVADEKMVRISGRQCGMPGLDVGAGAACNSLWCRCRTRRLDVCGWRSDVFRSGLATKLQAVWPACISLGATRGVEPGHTLRPRSWHRGVRRHLRPGRGHHAQRDRCPTCGGPLRGGGSSHGRSRTGSDDAGLSSLSGPYPGCGAIAGGSACVVRSKCVADGHYHPSIGNSLYIICASVDQRLVRSALSGGRASPADTDLDSAYRRRAVPPRFTVDGSQSTARAGARTAFGSDVVCNAVTPFDMAIRLPRRCLGRACQRHRTIVPLPRDTFEGQGGTDIRHGCRSGDLGAILAKSLFNGREMRPIRSIERNDFRPASAANIFAPLF